MKRKPRAYTFSPESFERPTRIILTSLEAGPKVEVSDSHAVLRTQDSIATKIRSLLPIAKERKRSVQNRKRNSLETGLTNDNWGLNASCINYGEYENDKYGRKPIEVGTVRWRRRATSNVSLYRSRTDSQSIVDPWQRVDNTDGVCLNKPSKLMQPMSSLTEHEDRQPDDCENGNGCSEKCTTGADINTNAGECSKIKKDGGRKGSNRKMLPEIRSTGERLNIVSIYMRYALQMRTKNSRIMKIKEDAWRRIEEINKEDDRLLLLRRRNYTASHKKRI